jgi:hypothetical protein
MMPGVSGSNTSKIEMVGAPGNASVWVDLCLDKRDGMFWARVGDETVREKTKEQAVKKTREALSRLENVRWRQVIVVSVMKNRRDGGGTSNGIEQRHASCSVSYERVERSPNPMRKGEEIERLHPVDFEEKVKEERESAGSYWGGTSGEKKERADEAESKLRQERSALAGSHQVWKHEDRHEHEIPYSEEAWAGIERIAATLRETQRRLDEFASKWTQDSLALLGRGVDAAGLFLPVPKLRGGGGKKKS